MAQTATIEPATEPAAGGKGRKMLLVGVVLGVAAVAAWFLLLAPAPAPPPGEAAAEPEPAASPSEGAVHEVATLTVNLDDPELRYARVQFGVVADAAATVDPTPRMPLLRDRAISTIAGFTPARLRTVDGHEELRAALTADAHEVWPDGEVVRVVLYDLIVQ